MNANRLLNMILRMVMRRAMRGGLNAGMSALSKQKDKQRQGDPSQKTQDSHAATTKRARQAMRVGRRIGRF